MWGGYMYGNKDAYKQYANIHISTVDRGRLLLMLYDGCINFLKHAKVGLESKDLPKFCRFLSKSQAIISELMLTLDFEKGGEIARELDRLYEFMLFHLTQANLEKSPAKVEEVIALLSTIAGAYREIIENGTAKRELDALEGKEPVQAKAVTKTEEVTPDRPTFRASL